jgi:hypothetical protein
MKKIILIFSFITLYTSQSWALDYQKDIEDLVAIELKPIAAKDIVVSSVKAQNEKNAELSLSDMKILDAKWIGEKRKSKRPLVKRVLGNPLSEFLKKLQDDSDGLYTEIIVMDSKGLNVAQSILSEHYWAGQSTKWEKTFGSKSYATYISDLHFDEGTEMFQVEVSFMIMSDDTPIGVLYAGIDVEKLEKWKKNKEDR